MSDEVLDRGGIGVGRNVGVGAAVGHKAKVKAKNIAGRDVIELHLHLVSPDDIKKIYQRSFPETYEGDRSYHNVAEALKTLWDVVDSNNKQLGVVRFLELFATSIENEDVKSASEIREYLNTLAQDAESRFSLADIEQSRAELQQQEQEEKILSIEIIPIEPRKQGQFQICFYPWQNGVYGEKYFEEELFTVDKIPVHVETVLNNRYRGKISTLELFVSIDILARYSQLDQLEYQDDLGDIFGIDIPLKRFGRVYEIVLRSHERQRMKILRDNKYWKVKWNHLTQCTDIKALVNSLSLAEADLGDQLRAWPTKKEKALVTLALPNICDLEIKLKTALGLLIGAGVPVILWSRKALLSLESHGERELMPIWTRCHQQDHKHLWKIVHDLRKDEEAITNPAHIGNHLTMVWDTPERMLPDPKESGE